MISKYTYKLLVASKLRGIGRKSLLGLLSDRLFFSSTEDELPAVLGEVAHQDFSSGQLSEVFRLVDAEVDTAERSGHTILSPADSSYPVLLRDLAEKPALLFVAGDVSRFSKKAIAVVGTREPTAAGRLTGERMTGYFCERGWQVVSGLALGVDTIAHSTSLKSEGGTVAVVAHGLDRVYPRENRRLAEEIVASGGLIVSEYTYKTSPFPSNFIERDRLQAGLARGVVMVQSDETGGSWHASRASIRFGRYLIIPKPTDSDIRDGEQKARGNALLFSASQKERGAFLKCAEDALDRLILVSSRDDYPSVESRLLENAKEVETDRTEPAEGASVVVESRRIVFISKATPEDDEFVLWMAPRLEAMGYAVFADILNLEPGDRWRKVVTETLQNKAIKMLLCCRDSTLSKNGVQEEIGIAEDLSRELKDPRFIIPLRIEPYKKVFGIGGLQYVDFVGSWAQGLEALSETLGDQGVPRDRENVAIHPNWEQYRTRQATRIERRPEALTLNWLRISEMPEQIRFFYPPGSINQSFMERACRDCSFPVAPYMRGMFAFASEEEVNAAFASVGRFVVQSEHKLADLIEVGSESLRVRPQEARTMLTSVLRKAWEDQLRAKGFRAYNYSTQIGFHVTKELIALGKRVPWGIRSQKRSSMLRNIASNKVWEYGVSAMPALWPFPHFRCKARVLFSALAGKEAGEIYDNPEQQHRFRRSVCKGWRNKAWHGRLMAFLEIASEFGESIELTLAPNRVVRIDAKPIKVSSPVTAAQMDAMSDDAEEGDLSTLGIAIGDEGE